MCDIVDVLLWCLMTLLMGFYLGLHFMQWRIRLAVTQEFEQLLAAYRKDMAQSFSQVIQKGREYLKTHGTSADAVAQTLVTMQNELDRFSQTPP